MNVIALCIGYAVMAGGGFLISAFFIWWVIEVVTRRMGWTTLVLKAASEIVQRERVREGRIGSEETKSL